MTPTEIWLLVEGAMPKSQAERNRERLVEWRQKLIEQGHEVL